MSSRRPIALAGQWVGYSEGNPPALVVIDLDPVEDHAKGVAYLYPQHEGIAASAVNISIPEGQKEFSIEGQVFHFDSRQGEFLTAALLSQRFPDVVAPTTVSAKFELKNSETMKVTWQSDIQTSGSSELVRMNVDARSKVASEVDVVDWRSFQTYVTGEDLDGYIYRGQSRPWPLQTSFHRTNRKDLLRYLREDVQRLHRALTGRTKHVFDLSSPQQNGAFLNLAQHNGFPTPLLDWTHSPFVAAYFAFTNVDGTDPSAPVRIYAFNSKSYSRRYQQHQTITFTAPHFSIIEPLAIENERAVPQQGLLALTNLNDIEGYLLQQEKAASEQFLFAFDIPRAEAPKALRDLSLMGITQATLFPGIESICGEHRSKFFA